MTIRFQSWRDKQRLLLPATMAAALIWTGCHHHRASITAVPLSPWNQCEPEGIPYYLPKPLLVVAKNVRHIDESKVGLTAPPPIPNAFDNQATYADVKANVTVPGSGGQQAANTGATTLPGSFDANKPELPEIWEKMTPAGRVEDGIAPDSFFTYQIIFVPDLSQKYGLRLKGGPGEMRAAMNLVNGWMYTGMGPFYIKDSSTAQNMMALGVGAMYTGRGVADVLNQVGNLAKAGAGGGNTERAPGDTGGDVTFDSLQKLARALQSETKVPQTMLNFAEVHIYEPEQAGDGTMGWRLIAEHRFDRQYFQPGLDPGAQALFGDILKHQAEMKKSSNGSGDGASKDSKPGGGGSSGGTGASVTNEPGGTGAPERGPAAGTSTSSTSARRDGVMERAERQFADSMFRPARTTGTPESAAVGNTSPPDDSDNSPVSTSTVSAPTTDVNIQINPRQHFRWGLPHLPNPFRRKEPPKQHTIIKTYQDLGSSDEDFDVNPEGRPGNSVSSTGRTTSPGFDPNN